MVIVRPEKPDDIPSIRLINERAFGQLQEADLVDSLRLTCPDALSLVAVSGQAVVGHILFTPVMVEGHADLTRGMGLAPMAVLPGYQRRHIGTHLVKTSLDILRQSHCPFVIVLGHPTYYPRFGFVPASQRGLRCQWADVPDQAFMVLILDEVVMSGVSGVVRYRDEFGLAMT